MNAVFGWFDSSTDVKAAVSSLKEEGFSEQAISVRDFEPITKENGEEGNSEASSSRIMVAVQAEGELAAKAWSVLHDVRKQLSKRN